MFKDRLIDFYYDTREFLRRNKKVVMPLFLLPVSYTHLTLPTIEPV